MDRRTLDTMNRTELETLFKEMVLGAIEAIIKHNSQAGFMIKSINYCKEDVALFHKKLLNLAHILHPVEDIARIFIQKEYPEYVYILDYIEKVYEELEGSK